MVMEVVAISKPLEAAIRVQYLLYDSGAEAESRLLRAESRYSTVGGSFVFWGSKPGSVIREVSCRERHNTCPEIGRVPLHHHLRDKQVASQASALPFSLSCHSLVTFTAHPNTSQ